MTRLLHQKRCDKLIVILSKSFCHQFQEIQDDLTRFIVKFAQSLQIRKFKEEIQVLVTRDCAISDDNRKIIPCARDNYGIAYNLKGYSVLNFARSGRLFSFWDRLAAIMENGRVSVDEQEIINKYDFTIGKESGPNEGTNSQSTMNNMFSFIKKKLKKKRKIKEKLPEQ
jgi:hypothetical protein